MLSCLARSLEGSQQEGSGRSVQSERLAYEGTDEAGFPHIGCVKSTISKEEDTDVHIKDALVRQLLG
jgi:hypothetical protein